MSTMETTAMPAPAMTPITALRETPVDQTKRLPASATRGVGFAPARVFADHAFAARLWFLVACPEMPAPVLLAYTPGRTFFSVRALEPNARAAVNVVWKNKTYVLRFAVAAEAYGSVTFYEDELAGRRVALPKRVTPETLLSLLDRAKSFAVIAQQYPEAAQQIEHTTPGSVSYYRDYRVTVEEIFRFDPEDTLVFRLRFENSGDTEVFYQPQRLAVRVGQNVYYASIADASGIIPPKANTTGFFAIYLACHVDHVRTKSNPHHLSAYDSSLLVHLDETTPVLAGDLSKHLGIAPSTLSAALDRLETLGYLTRRPNSRDRRQVEVRLTATQAKGYYSFREAGIL